MVGHFLAADKRERGRYGRAMAQELFSLQFDVDTTCVRCKAARSFPAEGEMILSAGDETGSTYIVLGAEPCRCGETRVRVSIDLEND